MVDILPEQVTGKHIRADRAVMMEWQPIETAPKDGTPFLAYCPEGIDRPGWIEPPSATRAYAIVWNGHPNPEQPREVSWVSADVQAEVFGGSEWTGSWTEYEFTKVNPSHWMPLAAPPVHRSV